MRATTIKVEGELLDELEKEKPDSESFASFVRSILEKEVVRRKMVDAAERYAGFLRTRPDEREWLEEWERSDVDRPVSRRKRR